MFTLDDKPARNVLVSCDHGLLIVNRFDSGPDGVGVGKFILEHGNNNTVEADVASKALMNVDSPVILDVGANIGTFATWLGPWTSKRNGKIYCFEPQRQVFQILCGNLAINNIFNVYAYELAVGNSDKWIDILEVDYDQLGSFAAFSLGDIDLSDTYKSIPNKYQRIKMTTIDKFVTDYNLSKVDYIKIDAEGLDLDVLEGAALTIEKYKPFLYVEYLNLGSSKRQDTSNEGKAKLLEILNQLGYNSTTIGHDIFAASKDRSQI